MASCDEFPWKQILLRSLKVAVVVGIVLNLINQPGAFWRDEPFNLTQSVLTFCVPFVVSTYGAVSVLIADRNVNGGARLAPETDIG